MILSGSNKDENSKAQLTNTYPLSNIQKKSMSRNRMKSHNQRQKKMTHKNIVKLLSLVCNMSEISKSKMVMKGDYTRGTYQVSDLNFESPFGTFVGHIGLGNYNSTAHFNLQYTLVLAITRITIPLLNLTFSTELFHTKV